MLSAISDNTPATGAMTDEGAPVKKGRGRPKKSIEPPATRPTPEKKKPMELPPTSDSEEENEYTSDTEKNGSPPPKPRSAVKKRTAEAANDKSEQPAVKRGRGRPRKEAKKMYVPTGRGRGRPRKNP